jgi:hypothetical protein
MSGDWEELLAQAKRRLAEQEAGEQEASAELGEVVELDEQEAFTGRYRGSGQTPTKRGVVDVVLLWDDTGAERFIWPKTRLQWELDELQPNVGDEIVIVRGTDIPSSDPDRNPTQRFAVMVRAGDDPLPDQPAEDDFPF